LRLQVSNAPIARRLPWFVLSIVVAFSVAIESHLEVFASVHILIEHFVSALS
jgi:hypothetical protein